MPIDSNQDPERRFVELIQTIHWRPDLARISDREGYRRVVLQFAGESATLPTSEYEVAGGLWFPAPYNIGLGVQYLGGAAVAIRDELHERTPIYMIAEATWMSLAHTIDETGFVTIRGLSAWLNDVMAALMVDEFFFRSGQHAVPVRQQMQDDRNLLHQPMLRRCPMPGVASIFGRLLDLRHTGRLFAARESILHREIERYERSHTRIDAHPVLEAAAAALWGMSRMPTID